jgi:hypothetical protein
MGKLFWAGSQATFTVSNKQSDNSGIKSVIIDKAASYYDTIELSSLTNTGAGTVANTNGNATFVSYINSATATFSPSIYVNWNSGGKTDSHSVGEVTLYNPVDTLTISEPKSILYTDADAYPITVSGAGKNNTPFANELTGYINIFGDILEGENKAALGTTDLKTVIQESLSTRFNESGTLSPTFTVETWVADTPTQTALSKNKITTVSAAGNVFTLRNATKSISLNNSTSDTSIYIAAGQTREISYTVNPDIDGIAYSYTLSFVKSPDTTSVDVTTVAPTKNAAGKFTINTKDTAAGKSTTIQLKSTATAKGQVLSPTVTIYITAANTTIYINVGDIYTMSVMDAETIAVEPDSAIASADIVGSVGTKQLKITAKNISGDTKQTSVTLGSGTVITINVAHIDVSIS